MIETAKLIDTSCAGLRHYVRLHGAKPRLKMIIVWRKGVKVKRKVIDPYHGYRRMRVYIVGKV